MECGLLAILLPDDIKNPLSDELQRLRGIFGDRAYCALTRRFLPNESERLRDISNAATQAGVPTVVTNDILYHCPSRRMLQDVVTCIRLHTTIDNAGFQKEHHADRFLKAPAEMLRLFPKYEASGPPHLGDCRALQILARSAEIRLSDRRARRWPQRAGAA